MRKLSLVVIILAAALVLLGASCNKETDEVKEDVNTVADKVTGISDIQLKNQAEEDLAIVKAQELCNVKLAEGEDLSNGPCISEDLMSGWVADIAHDPRQEVDDDPANQCQNYGEGKASHFVELDLNCKLIKLK